MGNKKEDFPFDHKPNKKLSDYIIDEIESEEDAISSVSFNTTDNQEISTEDIKICTDPDSPFFMQSEGESIGDFNSDINNISDSSFSMNGANKGNINSSSGINSVSGAKSKIGDIPSKKPNIEDLPIGLRNTLPKEEIEILSLTEDKIAKENLKKQVSSDEDRHVKPSRETTNKVVILLVTLGALLMMGYTTFAQPLAANSRQKQLKSNDGGSWDIRFTDMYQTKKIGSANELSAPTYNATKASFYVSLANPGDEITYNLTIKNNGTLNAKISSIYVMPENRENDNILYFVDGVKVGDILDVGQSTNMTVTAKYNEQSMGVTQNIKSVSVIVNYVQR